MSMQDKQSHSNASKAGSNTDNIRRPRFNISMNSKSQQPSAFPRPYQPYDHRHGCRDPHGFENRREHNRDDDTELQDGLMNLITRKRKSETTIEELRSNLHKSESDYKKLHKQNKQIKEAEKRSLKTIKELQFRLGESKSENSKLHKQIEEVNESRNESMNTVGDLCTQLRESKSVNKKLHKQIGNVKESKKESEAIIGDLRTNLCKSESENKKLNKQIEEVKESKKESKTTIEDLRTRLCEYESDNKKLRTQNIEMGSSINRLEDIVHSHSTKNLCATIADIGSSIRELFGMMRSHSVNSTSNTEKEPPLFKGEKGSTYSLEAQPTLCTDKQKEQASATEATPLCTNNKKEATSVIEPKNERTNVTKVAPSFPRGKKETVHKSNITPTSSVGKKVTTVGTEAKPSISADRIRAKKMTSRTEGTPISSRGKKVTDVGTEAIQLFSNDRKKILRVKKSTSQTKKIDCPKPPADVCNALYKYMSKEHTWGRKTWTRNQLADAVGLNPRGVKFEKGIEMLRFEKKLAEASYTKKKCILRLSQYGVAQISPEYKPTTLSEVHERFLKRLEETVNSSGVQKVRPLWAIIVDRNTHSINDVSRALGYEKLQSFLDTKILLHMVQLGLINRTTTTIKMADTAFPSNLVDEGFDEAIYEEVVEL